MGSSSAMNRLRWDHRDSKEYVLPQKEEDAKTTRMPYSLDGDDVAGTKQESPRTRGVQRDGRTQERRNEIE